MPSPAPGEEARLAYDVDPSIDGCPDAAAFRRLVVGRLGHDPFHPDAGPLYRALIVKGDGGELVGRAQHEDGSGTVVGARTVSTKESNCAELADALALAIALAVDPDVQPTTAARLDVDKPTPPTPAPAGQLVDGRRPWPLLATGAFGVAQGLAPGQALTATAGLGLGRSDLLGSLEVRWALPTEAPYHAGSAARIRVSGLMGSLVGCGRVRTAAACLSLEAGELRAAGQGFTENLAHWAWFSRAGGRVGFELAVNRWMSTGLWAEAGVTFYRAEILVNEERVWTMPRLGIGGFGQVRFNSW